MKNLSALCATFIFLSFFCSSVLAYQDYNSDFNLQVNNTSGYDFFGYSAEFGVGIFNPNPQWSAGSILLESPYTDGSVYMYLNITVPANTEIIAVIDSTANESISSYVSAFVAGNETPLITSPNNTLIIPSAVVARNIRVAKIGLAALPFTLNITKFKVYTLDLVEGRDIATLFLNETVEMETYCGAGSSLHGFTPTHEFSGCDFTYYVGVPGAGIPSYDYNHVHYYNSTIQKGIIIADDSEGQVCQVEFFGGTVLTRRVDQILSSKISTATKTRDPYYTVLDWNEFIEDFGAYQNCHMYYAAHFILSKLTLTQAQVTTLRDGEFHYLKYNGIPIAYANMTFINTTNMKADFSLIPYLSTASPAGTKWQYSHDDSDYMAEQDFFNADMNFGISCQPVSFCNALTGNTTFYGVDCMAIESTYCGACGCNANLTNCNYPSVSGAFCDGGEASHRGYFVNYNDCSPSTYGLCPSNSTCVNYTTSPHTVSCVGSDGSLTYCVDSIGTVKPCSEILSTTPAPTITGNFFSYAAGWFGSFFGLATNPGGNVNQADLDNANAFLSIIISLIVALIGAFYTRKEPDMAGKVFIAILLVLLIGFTLVGMFPVLFLILIIVLVIFLAAGAMSGILGGTKK